MLAVRQEKKPGRLLPEREVKERNKKWEGMSITFSDAYGLTLGFIA